MPDTTDHSNTFTADRPLDNAVATARAQKAPDTEERAHVERVAQVTFPVANEPGTDQNAEQPVEELSKKTEKWTAEGMLKNRRCNLCTSSHWNDISLDDSDPDSGKDDEMTWLIVEKKRMIARTPPPLSYAERMKRKRERTRTEENGMKT